MKKNLIIILLLLLILTSAGCGIAIEGVKKFWGSSTSALEKARQDALSQTFACSAEACFDAVFAMTKKLNVFQPLSLEAQAEPTATEKSDPPKPTAAVGEEATILSDKQPEVKAEEPSFNRFIANR
jgi:hypothetical protein